MAAPVGAKNGKAYLVVKEASKNGGAAQIAKLEFQYNPNDLTMDRKADWTIKPAKPAAKGSKPEFTGIQPRTLTVDVFLDSTDRKDHDITKDVKILLDTCEPTPKSIQQNKPSPPFVTFGWGKTIQFEAVVESVNITFLMFSAEGLPLRAKAKVNMKEVPKKQGGQNPTSGALAAQRTHTVVDGDSLASIAFNEYGDPGLWRAVAETNAIDDPLRLRAGTSLLLPDIEEASTFR